MYKIINIPVEYFDKNKKKKKTILMTLKKCINKKNTQSNFNMKQK